MTFNSKDFIMALPNGQGRRLCTYIYRNNFYGKYFYFFNILYIDCKANIYHFQLYMYSDVNFFYLNEIQNMHNVAISILF